MNREDPKFYGRRVGRKIRKTKEFLLENFLPCVRVGQNGGSFSPVSCFGRRYKAFYLEIGFGDGEHLAALSKDMPDCGFIGAEVYKNGVANLLSLLTGLKNTSDIPDGGKIGLEPGRADNVRIFDDDVRLLFARLPDDFFDKIYVLFPDPWPKTRHAARRFINPENLQTLARLLKKGGILQIATDHPVYKRHVLEIMHENSDFVWTAKTSDNWRNPPADWHETKYQRKALREGRRPVFFEYRRV